MTSISETHPEIVAENLFNFRDGILLGISTRVRWPEFELDKVTWDGVSVCAYPDSYCSPNPCLSLFIEKEEGGCFPELEGAKIRLFALPPRIGSYHGMLRCIHRGQPISEGILCHGKADFNVSLFNDVYVEVIRQNLSSKGLPSPMLVTAG